nr:MAG TPA: hypothetical protein [Caudoviricetes sp.]
MQEAEVSKTWRYVDARCTWKPIAHYLTRKWKRQDAGGRSEQDMALR